MNDELYQRLITAGVAEAEAMDIAKGFNADQADDGVDVERLTKAMEGIKETFAAETTNTEEETESLEKALSEATGIVDAVTQGADAILAEVRSQNDALAKGLLALGDEVKRLREHMDTNKGDLAKSLTAVQDQLSEPVVKSIGSAEAIAAPGDITASGEAQAPALIQKALKEMSTTTDNNRLAHLGTAIARLESFCDPSEVAREYSL